MALKTCPKCGEQCGPRKKKCSCGYMFTLSNHPLYPEPGGWVLTTFKGLPEIPQPDDLPRNRKMTNREIQNYVAYEGLGFAIYTLIPPDKIKDKRLAQLWSKAQVEMRKVVAYLESNVEEMK